MRLTFSHEMSAVSLETSPAVSFGAPMFDLDGTRASFATALAYATRYTIAVHATDVDGLDLAPTTLVFTTEPMPVTPEAPIIITREPADEATGVSIDATVRLTFSHAMNVVTLDPSPFAAPTFDLGATRATFVPSSPLAYATRYTFAIQGSNLDGVALAPATLAFTTAPMPVTQPGAPSAAQSSLTSTSTPVANNVDQAIVVFTCKDANGVTCAIGTMVALSSSDGSDLIGASPQQTGADGKATFTVTATQAGSHTLTATFQNGPLTLSLAFSAGPVANLIFSAPTGPQVTQIAFGPVTVAASDAFGNVVNPTISLALASTGALTATSTMVTATNGVATFTNVRVNRAGNAILRATTSGLTPVDAAPIPIVAWRAPSTDFLTTGISRIEARPTSAIIYARSYSRLYRSDDAGVTFHDRGVMPELACTLARDPMNDDVLYAGTEENGLWKSVNAGQSWSALANYPALGACALIAPTGGTIVVGSGQPTAEAGSWRSADGGSVFVTATGPISSVTVNELNWQAAGPCVVAATGVGVFRNCGAGFALVSSPAMTSFHAAIHPTNQDIVYATDFLSKPWRTTDGGSDWAALSGFGSAGVVRIQTTPTHVIIAASNAGGVFAAPHGTTGLSLHTTGVEGGVGDLSTPALDGSSVYAIGASVVHSADSGATWTALAAAAPETVSGIAASSGMVFVRAGGGLLSSATGEAPWEAINRGIPFNEGVLDVVALGAVPWVRTTGWKVYRRNGVVFGAVAGSGNLTGLATNGLDTVVVTSSGAAFAGHLDGAFSGYLHAPQFLSGAALRPSLGASVVLAWDATHIYRYATSLPWTTPLTTASVQQVVTASATRSYAASGTNGVFVSTDAGATWPVQTSVAGKNVRALAVNPATPMVVYAATDGGVYKSLNGGVSFFPVASGIGARDITAIAVHPSDPDAVYVGVTAVSGSRGGLYRTLSGGE